MAAAAGAEEVRFTNLNTRAIALLSATSLVTAVAGFFGKDLLDTAKLTGTSRIAIGLTMSIALVALVTVAYLLVRGVLLPTRRDTFGKNLLTDNPSGLASSEAVWAEVFKDYRAVHASLVSRNKEKVRALHTSYVAFLIAVAAIALGPLVVALTHL